MIKLLRAGVTSSAALASALLLNNFIPAERNFANAKSPLLQKYAEGN